jgi:hypothetical protein
MKTVARCPAWGGPDSPPARRRSMVAAGTARVRHPRQGFDEHLQDQAVVGECGQFGGAAETLRLVDDEEGVAIRSVGAAASADLVPLGAPPGRGIAPVGAGNRVTRGGLRVRICQSAGGRRVLCGIMLGRGDTSDLSRVPALPMACAACPVECGEGRRDLDAPTSTRCGATRPAATSIFLE